MRKGSYSEGKRYGFIFVKKIKPISKIEEIIYNGLNKDNVVIRKYAKDIEEVGITCSKIYYVSNKYLIQKYIKGQTVDNYINSNISDDDKIEMIKKILDLFKLSMNNPKIRIDWNLNNFIFNNKEIVLVDYIPCLYKDNLDEINTNITKDLYELYNNLDIQLCGIISYSMMPFIEYDKSKLEEIYKKIIVYLDNLDIIDRKKRHIFVDRILLIEKYLKSDMRKDDFVSKYRDLSLSKKMKNDLEMGDLDV